MWMRASTSRAWFSTKVQVVFLIWLNDGHTPMLLKIVQSHKIDPMRLITHRFKLWTKAP